MTKTLTRTFAALAAIIGFAQNAAADSSAQVLNAMAEDITVNGKVVPPKGTMHADFPFVVFFTESQLQYRVKDTGDKEGCGKMWRIDSDGPHPSHECLNIDLAQHGCVEATVMQHKGDDEPSIRLTQVAAGVCTDAWYQDNKAAADEIISAAVKITEAAAKLKGGGKAGKDD